MGLTLRGLHPLFVAEAGEIALRQVTDRATLDAIRAGMDQFRVLVFRAQEFGDQEQLEFAQRFDGRLHAKTGSAALGANRFGNEALTDISNVGADGDIMAREDRKRQYALGNRLWHTDASFQDPAGRHSMLHARVQHRVASRRVLERSVGVPEPVAERVLPLAVLARHDVAVGADVGDVGQRLVAEAVCAERGRARLGVQPAVEALREFELFLVSEFLRAEHQHPELVHPGADRVQRRAVRDLAQRDLACFGDEQRMQPAKRQAHDG